MAKIHIIYFDIHTGFYPGFHHGLAYLIGSLRAEKHSVFLTHLKEKSDYANAIEITEKEKPDIMGLSFTTSQKQYLRYFLDNAKPSGLLTIAGGVHATLVKEDIFDEFPELNGACIGDGEMPLGELCRRLDAKKDYYDTPSFYFKTGQAIIKNPILPLQNLDSLALPDYSLFDYKKIIPENGNWFAMFLSRGCPYDCYYCANHILRETYPNKGQYVRLCPPHHAIKIIQNNLSLYPQTDKIAFIDDTFTLNKKWLFDFCELYKRKIGLPFLCNARVENIDDDVAKRLKESGCVSIELGVESGNEWLRTRILNRRHSNSRIEEAFAIVKKHDIKRQAYIMFGLPFETGRMQEDSMSLIFRLWPNIGKCYYFFPFPKTVLGQISADYGLLLDDMGSKTSYLEGPTLKEIFVSHKETIKNYQIMQLFFYTRILSSKIGLPVFLEKLLFKIIVLFRRPIFFLLNPVAKNRIVVFIRPIMRKLMLRYLR